MDHIFLFLFFPLRVKPEHKASFCLKDSVHQLPAFVKASRKLIGYRMPRPIEKKVISGSESWESGYIIEISSLAR